MLWIVLCSLSLSAQSASPKAASRLPQLDAEARSAAANGDVATAIQKYQEILKLSPNLGPAYYDLGVLYVRLQDYAKAVAILQAGAQADPTMQSAAALLGTSFYYLGEYPRARPQLEAALRENPENNDVELYLAGILMSLGEFQAAEGHLQTLVRRQPENQEVWYLLGTAYMDLSKQAYLKVDAIDPNSVLAHEIKGDVMSETQNFERALAEYNKAAEMDPKDRGIHYKMGNIYAALSDWTQATQEFQAELANDPANCSARWKLGNVLLESQGNPGDALADVVKAIDICPNLMQARVDRARALIRLNRHADALPDLQAAAKAAPDDAFVHFYLAQAYRGLGRAQEAQAEMEVFSKLDQGVQAAIAARKKEGTKAAGSPPDN